MEIMMNLIKSLMIFWWCYVSVCLLYCSVRMYVMILVMMSVVLMGFICKSFFLRVVFVGLYFVGVWNKKMMISVDSLLMGKLM